MTRGLARVPLDVSCRAELGPKSSPKDTRSHTWRYMDTSRYMTINDDIRESSFETPYIRSARWRCESHNEEALPRTQRLGGATGWRGAGAMMCDVPKTSVNINCVYQNSLNINREWTDRNYVEFGGSVLDTCLQVKELEGWHIDWMRCHATSKEFPSFLTRWPWSTGSLIAFARWEGFVTRGDVLLKSDHPPWLQSLHVTPCHS